MSDWTSGYVADVAYTYGYYIELNPLRARLPLLNAGIALPETGAACELGFGQGLSINTHAAASSTAWSGTDFNPVQAGFAQELSRVAGVGARVYDEAFAEFCARPDLPDFDFIGLHGIWSWISDENRHVIVDFARRKLKVGGVLYVSYNTLPGWASFAPMRHLMTQHADALGAAGSGIVNRINGSLDFADRLMALNPGYARSNPNVADKLKKVKEHNRHYLAHEYFNRDWHPMYFSTMAQWLEPAKLGYACSANYLDHVDALNLTQEQQALLKDVPDPLFRETVRDFVVNQQFRKDYWVKGVRKLPALEQAEGLRSMRFVLTTPRADVALKLNGVLGEVTLGETIYVPILDILADHKPHSILDIERAVVNKGISLSQVVQAFMILGGMNHVAAVQDDAVVAKAKKTTDKLNTHLAQKARASGDIIFAASPVLGGGHVLGRFPFLFLQALAQGKKQPAEMAASVWQILLSQSQKILKDGKTLETAEENLAELTAQAKVFVDKQLPVLKALQIA